MFSIKLPTEYPVTAHTDFVGKGSIFIAIPGTRSNGLVYVPLALQKGAQTIVIQEGVVIDKSLKKLIDQYGADVKVVKNCRRSLAEMSAQSLGYPSKKLKIIGVTGTKGKTSTSYMIYYMLRSLGKKVALSSTVEKLIEAESVKVPLTTPLPDQLHMFFHLCLQHGIEYVVLEVSAQALSLYRVEGIDFEAGVFTNFSMEHLEFYKNMQDYFNAKSLLVKQIKNPENMFINIDDQYGVILKKRYPKCSSFSLEDKSATIYGWPHFKKHEMSLHLLINKKRFLYESTLLGKFNVYNLLSAFGVLDALGFDLQDLMTRSINMNMIPGRMEQYKLKNNAYCFIDYAHNPSSFEAVLSTLRTMTDHLIVVFGAGGCRDKTKRPIMGSVAQRYCDIIILTSDNPRDENPQDIMNDIQQGVDIHKIDLHKVLNRTEAIEYSYSLSRQGSIIAVLGKGRDEYQIVGDLTFPFKERSIIKKFVQEL